MGEVTPVRAGSRPASHLPNRYDPHDRYPLRIFDIPINPTVR